MTIALVAIGGALGAVTRYLLAIKLYGQLGIGFPWGTLGVNVAASLALGAILGLVESRDAFTPNTRLLITTGFLGGMSTFSTFVYEGWHLFRDGDPARAFAYIAISLLASFAAFTGAFSATKAV